MHLVPNGVYIGLGQSAALRAPIVATIRSYLCQQHGSDSRQQLLSAADCSSSCYSKDNVLPGCERGHLTT